MQLRRIIIPASVVLVLGLIGLLLLEVTSDSDPEIPADKRAKALAEYERRQRLAQAPAPAPIPSSPARRRVRRPKAESSAEREPPERPSPAARARPMVQPRGSQAARLSVNAPKINITSGSDDPERDERMKTVRSAYDRGDYPQAQRDALEALEKSPRDIKLLRYVVSSSCAIGEYETAAEHIVKLPERDQKQMRSRCAKWGADL